MDPQLFAFVQLEIPRLSLEYLITDQVDEIVGGVTGIHAITNSFFQMVHSWMPIVCKKSFSQLLVKRMMEERAELFLLVLSMKLCGSLVTQARTDLYELVKQYSTSLERSGNISLMVLQAGVLIALYEMGHGLYPEAYFSVSQCARYGTALGIDKSIVSNGVASANWSNLEEACRVWWSILVLDR